MQKHLVKAGQQSGEPSGAPFLREVRRAGGNVY